MILRKTYKEYVLETAASLCPIKKKSIYSYSYYYDMFYIVLKNLVSWNSLSITSHYINKSKYHYTTVRKMFNKWSKSNVFKIAYNQMITDYKINNLPTNSDVFIDACFMNNKTGSNALRAFRFAQFIAFTFILLKIIK